MVNKNKLQCNGFVQVPRKALEDNLFNPKRKYTRAEAYVWLLSHCSFKDGNIINFMKKDFKVNKNQLVSSQATLAGIFGWKIKKTRLFLDYLVKKELIKPVKKATQSGAQLRTQFSLIEIISCESVGAQSGAQSGAHRTKNVLTKKELTKEKTIAATEKPVTASELVDELGKLVNTFPEEMRKDIIKYLHLYKPVKLIKKAFRELPKASVLRILNGCKDLYLIYSNEAYYNKNLVECDSKKFHKAIKLILLKKEDGSLESNPDPKTNGYLKAIIQDRYGYGLEYKSTNPKFNQRSTKDGYRDADGNYTGGSK